MFEEKYSKVVVTTFLISGAVPLGLMIAHILLDLDSDIIENMIISALFTTVLNGLFFAIKCCGSYISKQNEEIQAMQTRLLNEIKELQDNK